MIYKVGVRITTNVPIRVLLMRWQNFRKQDNRNWVPIYQAESQKYAKVYQVGFCLGSTEGQNVNLLNSRIGKEVDNKQIETSFQSINQAKVANEYWKEANEKTKTYKGTQSFNKAKFQWAPKALIVYATDPKEVPEIRKVLMMKLGKNTDEGVLPIWPDRSSMKFCPLKGKAFNDISVQKKVFESVGTHVWIKAQTMELELKTKNMDSEKKDLKGKLIMEAVLALTIPMDKKQFHPFLHETRMWSRDENEDKWGAVVHSKLHNVASKVLSALKDKLFTEYGETVKKYFKEEKRGYLESYNANVVFNEELWFNFEEESVDDILGGQAKVLLVDGFKDFINNDITSGGKRRRLVETSSIPTAFYSGGSTLGTVSATTTIDEAIQDEEENKRSKVQRKSILRKAHQREDSDYNLKNMDIEETKQRKVPKKNKDSSQDTDMNSDCRSDSDSESVSVQWSEVLGTTTTTVRMRLKNINKALKMKGITRKVREKFCQGERQ